MLQIIRSSDQKALERVLRAGTARLAAAEGVARRILADVRRQGDRAVIRYTKRFDHLDLRRAGFTVTAEEIREAYRAVPRGFVQALRQAARNIRTAARRQLPARVANHNHGRACASARLCAPSSAWRATFPADASPCPPRC